MLTFHHAGLSMCVICAMTHLVMGHRGDLELEGEIGISGRLASEPPAFTVKQYNILAGYLGQNTQPWFLYGKDLSKSERELMMKRFYEKDPVTGKYINNYATGFGKNANGELFVNTDDKARIEAIDRAAFEWEGRKWRLLEEILRDDPAIVLLEELDHYTDFFDPQMRLKGYDSVWEKRPRRSSDDGCGIFWKRERFSLDAKRAFQLKDPSEVTGSWDADFHGVISRGRGVGQNVTYGERKDVEYKNDRIALAAIIRDLHPAAEGRRVLAISTHLQRNPEKRGQDAIRKIEMGQIRMAAIDFGVVNNLDPDFRYGPGGKRLVGRDAVIFGGDLNYERIDEGGTRGSQHTLEEAAEIAMDSGWFCDAFPSSPNDDGCTTVTTARKMWIDYLRYSIVGLEAQAMLKDPCPANPIPDVSHPSDHVPIAVRFAWRPLDQVWGSGEFSDFCEERHRSQSLEPFSDPAPGAHDD